MLQIFLPLEFLREIDSCNVRISNLTFHSESSSSKAAFTILHSREMISRKNLVAAKSFNFHTVDQVVLKLTQKDAARSIFCG